MRIGAILFNMEKEEKLYEDFQEWLNTCPIEISNYLDFTNEFKITFKLNKQKKPQQKQNEAPN